MENTYLERLIILALLFGLCSCSTSYYYPTCQNVLRFKEKGDVNLSVGADENEFYNYNLGYSITDNVALISDFKTFRTYPSEAGFKYNIEDYLWDNELILYKKLEGNFYPAVNFGYGFGKINRNEDYYNLDVNRLYIQPSFGYSNKFFDVALSTRFSRVHHNLTQLKTFDLSSSKTFEEYFELGDVGKKDFYFLEPALTIGVGYKFVKLRYQGILNQQLSSGNIKYEENNWNLTLNFTFNINQLFTNRKE